MKKEVVIAVVMLTLGVLLGSVLAVGAQSAAPLRVVYLVNGSLGDKGFYDSAASGLYRMRDELGAEIKIIEMGAMKRAMKETLLTFLSRIGI